MKIETAIITLLLVALTFLSCTNSSDTSSDQQPEMVDENLEGVEETVFENEYVQALEVSLEPDQRLPWHEGGPRVVYSLTKREY